MTATCNDPRPPPPAWLNEDLVQTALRKGDNDSSIIVLSCDFSMANAVGDGYMSDMYRVIAKLQDGRERRLIVKCQPKGGMQEDFIKRTSAFEKETHMLTETLPAMQKLLQSIGVSQCLAPKCFLHGEDPVPFLVLEDLCQAGFMLGDRLRGLDLTHCSLVMKTLALFHASSLALFHRDPEARKMYEKFPYDEEMQQETRPMYDVALQLLGETVLTWPGYERFAEKIRNIRENVADHLMAMMARKDDRLNTLIHGDTWTNNIMFKYSENNVEDVRLLDFQLSYFTTPTIDLQYFLNFCPNKETQHSIYPLLEEYHHCFTETLDKLGCNSHSITFEDLKRQFEENMLFGLIFTATFLPSVATEESRHLNLDDILNSSDSASKNLKNTMQNEFFVGIMKRLLVKCSELSVF